eukprot:CAMPEP_0113485258 /NCGR_PEP_ID=MMETSP0014_2-20120614/24389_1 /TAXON_ID=2857 /ORGANISM="Nitzschia sp." /LENGTH=885 /DNA_ID=CAMNT_0000378895 /DNA_START=15 /DNA_END=2672 /DNA_ORIENTATION=- /assembly_acc=CAM_ASM_000159
MRKDRQDSGSSQESNDHQSPGKSGRREPRKNVSIRGKVNLAERAKSFDANFKNPFNEAKFNTFSPEAVNRSKSFSNNDNGGVFAFHKNYPSLSEEQRRNLEGQIQNMSKEERALVERRRQAQERMRSPAQIPKRRGMGEKMKKMLDDSDHRRITNSSVRPVHLPMTNFGKGHAVGEIDDAPITKHAVKLKNVCAPKLRVDPKTFKPQSNPKTELQRKLLKKVINKNFVLKDHHSDTEKALVDAMQTVDVRKGEILAKEGDTSEENDNFYVLEKGKVEFLLGNERVKTAKAGESFGEERLLLRVPNETTVRALEPSTLLKLNQAEYRAIVEKTVTDNLPPPPKSKSKSKSKPSPSTPTTPKTPRSSRVEDRKPAASQRPPRPPSSRSSSPDVTRTPRSSSPSAMKSKTTRKKRTSQSKPKPKTDEYEIFDPSSLEQHSAEFQRQAKIRRSVKKHANDKDDLEFIKVLGEGQFGEVWLVAATLPDIDPPKQKFAYKIQSKNDEEGMREDAVADIKREIDILDQIHHPFICNLVNTYESEDSLDMLLGLIPGGELWDQIHIEDPETGEWESGLSEHRAQFIAFVLADTFAFFHLREFLFRDLKPENIMLDADGYPCLVDFGFAKHVPTGGRTFTFCGTPNYVAPEIVRNAGQSVGVDHWALGVVVHEMVSGENPFFWDDMGQVELYQAITDEDPSPIPDDKVASAEVRDFISQLLVKDPEKRLGFNGPKEIMKHPWFKDMPSIDDFRAKNIKAPKDNDVRPPHKFIDGYKPPPPPVQSDDEEEEEQEEVVIEKPKKEYTEIMMLSPTKVWKTDKIIEDMRRKSRQGYYATPKTDKQRSSSQERRKLLGNRLTGFDAEGNGISFGGLSSPTKSPREAPTKRGMNRNFTF